MSPREAKTHSQICRLRSDNADTAEGWIIIEQGDVTLCTQKNGQDATGKVVFSRRAFNALIDWYNRPQKLVKRKSPPAVTRTRRRKRKVAV